MTERKHGTAHHCVHMTVAVDIFCTACASTTSGENSLNKSQHAAWLDWCDLEQSSGLVHGRSQRRTLGLLQQGLALLFGRTILPCATSVPVRLIGQLAD